MNCPICFDEITTIDCLTTKCDHKYHASCMFEWISNNNTCPTCRQPLTKNTSSVVRNDENVVSLIQWTAISAPFIHINFSENNISPEDENISLINELDSFMNELD